MPRENKPGIRHELDTKLRQVQVLISDSINLVTQLQVPAKRFVKPAAQAGGGNTSVRFDLNERAFVKRYAKNISGGQRKFTLLLAFLAKGDTAKDVSLNDIEQVWNKTSSKTLLGMKFNRFFPTTAKEHGWVNSRKRGFYNLERSWKDVFSND